MGATVNKRGTDDDVDPAASASLLKLKLISRRAAAQVTALHPRSIGRLEAQGRFPQSVKISDGRIAYVHAEVLAWLRARIRERR